MNKTKVCSKCGILKSMDDFGDDKSKKSGKRPDCKKCVKERAGKYYRKHRKKLIDKAKKRREENSEKLAEESRIYYQDHKKDRKKYHKEWYERIGREKAGHLPMYKNKLCPSYLGVVIAERLVRHLFDDVETMSMHNPGFDFVCNRGKKIDVKSSSTRFRNGKFPRWIFEINHNNTADFFICVAFDNRTDLNPLHMWMIPGHILSKQGSARISLSTICKWNKWKMDINDAQICCTELKNREKY